MEDVLKAILANPKENPVFEAGQTVRVISKIDVNMPASLNYWLNAKCEVLRAIPRGFVGREWCYELKHPNGAICEFKTEELDLRYRKRKSA
jgi:hypothetical protein